MKWFKFYGQDYLSDPKILALSGGERSCWLTLLCYGSINDNGMITFLDEQQLIAQSGISPMHEEWDQTIGVLKKFERLQMITLDNEMITIINWGKRQEINLTGYERVKKYRQKKKDDNADDNEMITIDKIRIDKNRLNKSIENSAKAPTPSQFNRKFFENKDFRKKQVEHLKISDQELDKFISYWNEPNKSGTKVRWELEKTFDVTRRLRTWLGNNFSKVEEIQVISDKDYKDENMCS